MQVSNNLREQVKQLQKSFELGVEMTGHLLTYLDEYPERETIIIRHIDSLANEVLVDMLRKQLPLITDQIHAPHAND